MLTYVINTSENKTFESDKLFDLSGYNKIRWINCRLDELKKCAEYIYEKQNILGADNFRIAVLVDFYSFDRIRVPYGRRGFGREFGVDISLYMPYIEIYLLDNLLAYLERRELYTFDFEIYYVQNEKSERYELMDSAKEQLSHVLTGYCEADNSEVAFVEKSDLSTDSENQGTDESQKKYKSFLLYCTSKVSLEFKLSDYPYGYDEMTFLEFWDAFRQRMALKPNIRRHYYITNYGGGASRAAFDTLSLSLYLVRMYEREEKGSSEGEMEVIHLDSTAMKEVLEIAWSKINVARVVAKKNELSYYSLVENIELVADEIEKEMHEEKSLEESIAIEKVNLPKEVVDNAYSGEKLYDEIVGFSTRTPSEVKDRNRKEFDDIMSEYLVKRDETRDSKVKEEFDNCRDLGFLKMTSQCPSQDEYNHLIKKKKEDVSKIFERVLASEYIEVSYEDEKKKADEAYIEYKKAKACLHRNIIGDIIFMIITILAMVTPYIVLQLTSFDSKTVNSLILGLNVAAMFGGIFILAVLLQMLPLISRMNKAKGKLYDCYLDCCAKERHSFSALRRRYKKDLINIEQTRYELRQLKQLHDANTLKDQNVSIHRKTLEEVADCISSILNNLDVEPIVDPNESVDGEFDLSKPIRARENSVYRIFSIEAIEKMFPKKGSDDE